MGSELPAAGGEELPPSNSGSNLMVDESFSLDSEVARRFMRENGDVAKVEKVLV